MAASRRSTLCFCGFIPSSAHRLGLILLPFGKTVQSPWHSALGHALSQDSDNALGAHAFVAFSLAVPLRSLLRRLLLLGEDRLVRISARRVGRNGEGYQNGKGENAEHDLSFLGRSMRMLTRRQRDSQN